MIMPSEWLPEVWGGEHPEFAGPEEAQAVMGAIMRRYDDIPRCLREEPDQFSPVVLEDPEGKIVASDWAMGFMDAVRLRGRSWEPLFRDEHGSMAMLPILLLASSEDMVPPEIAAAVREKDFLNHAHEYLPASVIAIDGFWKRRHGKPSRLHLAAKTGRNDPCPCGSGRKHKKCCGAS